LIAGSRFLTGHNSSGFKVTLDWALVPDNAYKVLEGAIYDKPKAVEQEKLEIVSWEEFSEELARKLPSSPYLLQWLKMSVIIAKFIGQEKYQRWFSKVGLKEVNDRWATFWVDSLATQDYITRNFFTAIRIALQDVYPAVRYWEFEVLPSKESAQEKGW
jgi:hypothetical protein